MSSRRRRAVHPAIRIAIPLAAVLLACLAALQLWPGESPAARPDEPYRLSVRMLDVGQGDSVLIASGGEYALVDAGENDRGDDVTAALRALGVKRLAAAVGTHPHSDHIGGLDTVLDGIPADRLYLSPRTEDTETYEDVLDAAERQGLGITIPKPGDTFRVGEATVTFLWPPKGYDSDNVNNCSLVLMVEAGGYRALLCGDIEKGAEKALLDSGTPLDCDVLKVAHHGSDSSSGKDFLAAASPKIALISVGGNNDYKHPDKDVLGRLLDCGAKYYRTDLEGIISVLFNDDGISVSTEN